MNVGSVRRLGLGNLVGKDVQGAIFLADLLSETNDARTGRGGDDRHVALGVGVGLGDRLGEGIGGDATSLDFIGRHRRGQRLGIGSGIDCDNNLDRLRRLLDRRSKRARLRGSNDDRRWMRVRRFLEKVDLARNVGLCLGTQCSNVGAQILTCLARASEHGLPVDRRRVFHNDRDCWLGLRHGRRYEAEAGENAGG